MIGEYLLPNFDDYYWSNILGYSYVRDLNELPDLIIEEGLENLEEYEVSLMKDIGEYLCIEDGIVYDPIDCECTKKDCPYFQEGYSEVGTLIFKVIDADESEIEILKVDLNENKYDRR